MKMTIGLYILSLRIFHVTSLFSRYKGQKKMHLKWVVVLMVIVSTQVEAAKILGLFWTFSKSHHIPGSALLQALAKAGHEVHLLSTYNDDVKVPNFKQELLTGIIAPGDDYKNPNRTLFTTMLNFIPVVNSNVDKFWENKAVQELIKTKPKYDVVVVLTFLNDYVLALPHYLGVPTIIFSTMSSNEMNNKYVANPNLPYGSTSEATMNTFFGRLWGTSFNIMLSVIEKYFLAPVQDRINKEYLPNTPPIEVLNKNVSLVLVNSHFAIERPMPYVPNMIQIGGFHTQEVKKLPENLQKFLDSAVDGAVLFCMGSIVKIEKQFDKGKLDVIMTGLGKLAPMKVVFKSEIEIPSAPKNVLISKWLPQNDILAHPNIKLFICHGGLGGTTEAVFHGVPMLGIPFFADQKSNMASATEAGFSLTLEFNEITQKSFDASITELLKNPKYTTNVKIRSSLLRNYPITALEKAIWWVEHIIEYKGGDHLRNVGMDLEWYQLYMVDVMLFVLAVISLVLVILFFLTRFIFRKLSRVLGGKSKKVKRL